jgi:site-specific recombinase XerD
MSNTNFSDKLSKDFFIYLSSLGLSARSLKFYKSDLSHFSGWLIFRVKTLGIVADELTQIIPFLNEKMAWEYINYLSENHIPGKTVNRRLSTLRHLGQFLLISQILPYDFAVNLCNVPDEDKNQISYEIIKDFEKHLIQKKVTKNTIKSYLSDIRQFISWLEVNHQSPNINH